MDKIFKKIDRYLASDRNTPIIVDVRNKTQLIELRLNYETGATKFVPASQFCKTDSLPKLDAMLDNISHQSTPVFLTELSTFLKLQGEQVLKQKLKEMLDIDMNSKLVIVTYQCRDYLKYNDPRLTASSRIVVLDGEEDTIKQVVLMDNAIELSADAIETGIQRLPAMIEDETVMTTYLKTSFNKKTLESSLIPFHALNSSYSVLTLQYKELKNLNESLGVDEQWNHLVKEINKVESWQKYVCKLFGNENSLKDKVSRFSDFDPYTKWVYFLAMKYYGVGGEKYLTGVLNTSESLDSFAVNLYESILGYDYKHKDYAEIYNTRKEYLKGLKNISELSSFCKKAESKGKEGLYYLTDNTLQEKELIIEMIVRHEKELHKELIEDILQQIYPSLYYYLQQYYSGITLVDEYIQLYKYCKLTNQILPEMQEKVDLQAKKREYNTELKTRSYHIDKIDKTNSALYFFDALGVEFLSYVDYKCADSKLKMEVSIARCDLPSITSINKDFVEDFKKEDCNKYDVKELDELKHGGNLQYNFETTKLPIHIVKELEIIDKVFDQIYGKLVDGEVDKVVVVADHGASRLAVLHNTENKIEVKEKGMHSGRCCPKTDTDDKPENATEENGFWCLANYDLFRGGRKTGVEVHGGASLEEVAVPIIELSMKGKDIECYIMPRSKTISVSYKKLAKLKLYIDTMSTDVSVICDGMLYDCKQTGVPRQFEVEMKDVNKKGEHTLDVRVDGNVIAKGLEFTVKKEGASERKFF